jgi:hypothetical protein
MSASNRWLNWQPKSVADEELTKLTKPDGGRPYLLEIPRNHTDKTDKTPSVDGFVSFVSSLPGQIQKIQPFRQVPRMQLNPN